MNKPPEKIYLNYFNDTGNPMFDGFSPSPKPDDTAKETFEYHLAPVWHDAKTDPPTDNDIGFCEIYAKFGEPEYHICTWTGFWYDPPVPVEYILWWRKYTPLPLPTERSGE
jgi:hypothetical protein